MKKIIAIIFTLTMIFSLTACGEEGAAQGKLKASDANKLAVECLDSILNAESIDEVEDWLTEDSKSSAQTLVEFYEGKEVSIEAEYKTEYKGHDIFYYEARDLKSKEIVETGYSLLQYNDSKYLLCVDKALQADVRKEFMCGLCNGGGSVGGTADIVCGICGGTGVQYMPSAYFDAATQTWMGQNMACSGCGGAGRHPGVGGNTCPGCNGQCVVFD